MRDRDGERSSVIRLVKAEIPERRLGREWNWGGRSGRSSGMGSLTLETSDQRRHRVDTTPRNHPDLTSVTHGRDRICCHTAENQHYIPSWSGALFCNSIKRFGVRVFHPIVCASSCRRGIKPSIPSGRRSRCCFRPGKSKGRKWSMAHLFLLSSFLS